MTVDANGLRFNQILIIVLTILAFVAGVDNGGAWVVLATGASLALGFLSQGNGPFQLLYRRLLVPAGLITPRPEREDPRAPRFAQAMGSFCLVLSSLLLFIGWHPAGWALAWIVVALALVNVVFGFCTGCFIFLQLDRLLHPGNAR
ncbi:MAG: DUF4395 domain-containing protein [Thermomicrobiales bacterium]